MANRCSWASALKAAMTKGVFMAIRYYAYHRNVKHTLRWNENGG